MPDGWTRVRLGEVITRTSKRCTPEVSPSVRWIGADHLEEGDLAVRRWSTTDDPMFPPTFSYSVPSGSVLLHSRNPKKVAILPFDAITGEKLFCLTPVDSSALDSRFLAYQLQSDHFNEFVGRWLSGSVNKFLNWTALAQYEFALPPIEEQQRLVNVFSSFDKEQSALRNARTAAAVMRLSVLQALDETTEMRCRLGDLVDLERGVSYKSSDYVEEGTGRPFLNLKCVTRQGTFSAKGVKWVRNDFMPGNVVSAGELFFANTDLTPGRLLVGAPFFFRGLEAGEEPCFSMDLTRVRLKASDVPVELVYHLLNIPRVRAEMRRLTGGSTVGHLRLGGVPIIEVPLVSDVLPVLARLRSFEALEDSLADHEKDSRSLAASVRERLLGGGINVQ